MLTAFSKHKVSGPGAKKFLDWFTSNKLPNVGRINLSYALTVKGTIRSEFTIITLSDEEFYMVSAGSWTLYDYDYMKKNAEDKEKDFGHINIHDVTNQWGVFAIAGPKSRDLLKSIINSQNGN